MTDRVLVVQKDAMIRRLLVSSFEREGLGVEATGDGRTAMDLIRSGRFDVVVLELLLPRLSGFDVLHACGALMPRRPAFIVLTALDASLRSALEGALVTAVMMKPFDIVVVCSLVRETAHQHSMDGAATRA
jgi:DNA-binding response OmpR family regulator